MPRIVIIDSGLRGLSGHNFSYTHAVRNALLERGATVHVFVNRAVSSELAAAHALRPTFSSGAYDFPPGRGRLRDLAYVYAQSRVFAKELEHALHSLGPAPDLVFTHTLADFELLGWVRHLNRNEFPGRLAVVLRQTPRYRTCTWLRRTVNPYWRLKPHTLGRMRRRLGTRFQLCTDSQALSDDYACIYKHEILTLPLPLSPLLYAPHPEPAKSVSTRYGLGGRSQLRIGYLGEARAAKGFQLLPALIRDFVQSGKAGRFVIQCPSPSGADEASIAASGLGDVGQLASQYPDRVTLIPEKLTNEDYGDLARNLDLVLIPYLHDSYREATSGIFAEAVALGKPVVVPSDCWMSRELQNAGSGLVFARESPTGLIEAVSEAVRDYPLHAAAAEHGREAWKAFHSAGTLADVLLRTAPTQQSR